MLSPCEIPMRGWTLASFQVQPYCVQICKLSRSLLRMVVCSQGRIRKTRFQFLLRIHPFSLETRPDKFDPVRVLITKILFPSVPARRRKSARFAHVVLMIRLPPSHNRNAHQGSLTITQAPNYHHLSQFRQSLQFSPLIPIAFLGVPQNSKARFKINAQSCDESAYVHRHCC